MELIVLGNNAPFAGKNSACSGYLLRDKDINILIDCGPGVVSRMQEYCDFDQISGVFISHFHPDHISDIFSLSYGVAAKTNAGKITSPLHVYCPEEPAEDFARLKKFSSFLNVQAVDYDNAVVYGDMEMTFHLTLHTIPCFALSVTNNEGKKFVYSADTRYSDLLVRFVKDADLFLSEAGTRESDRKNGFEEHLTGKEAGNLAKLANVKKLLLTHFYPEYNPEEMYQEAKLTYQGALEISQQGKIYEI